MANFIAGAALVGTTLSGIAAASAAPVTIPIAATVAYIASIGGFLAWLFSKGPKKQNKTMLRIQEKLKLEEEIAEKERNNKEKARKIEKDRKRNALQMAVNQRQLEEMAAEMEREKQKIRRELSEAVKALEDARESNQRLADEQKQHDQRFLDQQRQAVETAKHRDKKIGRRRRQEEEAMAVAKQQNEEEKCRLIEEEEKIKERGRSLQDDIVRVERAAREMAENRVQPILWPTREEFRQALENVQYSNKNFHFAIAGKAGSGKSSLINAFLNLRSKDPGAVPTGTKETTLKITRYPDPGDQPPRSQTVWFDVPGAGTQRFSSWQYFNKLGLFVFDFTIVAIGDRFEETDCQILQACRQFKIPTFIVRSKADQHILNSMQEEEDLGPECYWRCRETFINDTEQMVSEGLRRASLPGQKVYIVSRDTLRKTYSGSLEGLTMPQRAIHKVKLVEDLMQAAIQRRCDTKETALGRAKAVYAATTSSNTMHHISPAPKEKHASSVQTERYPKQLGNAW